MEDLQTSLLSSPLLSGTELRELQLPCLLPHSRFCHVNLERGLESSWVSLCRTIIQKASRWSVGAIEELIPFVFYLAGIIILHGLMPNVLKTIFFFSVLSPIFSEKAMAPHSRTLAWKIPWKEEPGALQSMGSQRVGHD